MAKLTLNAIGSRYGSIDALNDNFDAIEQALENTLSRDGTSPNALEADLDMNGNSILNAGDVNTTNLYINGVQVEPSIGVTSGAVFQTYEFTATAGQTLFSVAPSVPQAASLTVSVNGLVLPPSEISVNSTNVILPACTAGDEILIRRYTTDITGSYVAPTSLSVQRFSGNGVTTSFTLGISVATGGASLNVYVGGIYQNRNTYTSSGNVITFTEAPPAGTENIEVLSFDTVELGETSSDLVSYLPEGTGVISRTVQSKLRESVSVKDFGAVGDGVTDDKAAIQAAIDQIEIFGGGVIVFPRGTYLVESNLLVGSNVTLQGTKGGSIIKAGNSLPTNQSILRNRIVVSFTNNNISLVDMIFDGSGLNKIGTQTRFTALVALSRVTGAVVRGCEFKNCGYMLLEVGFARNLLVTQCKFTDWGFNGATPNGGSAIWCTSTDTNWPQDVKFIGNEFTDGRWHAIHLSANGAVFSGNTIRNAQEAGMFCASSIGGQRSTNVVITGNVIDGITRRDISGHAMECEILGGVISGNFISNCDHGGIAIQNCQDLVVSNNVIRNVSKFAAAGWGGLDFIASKTGDNRLRNVILQGNIVADNQTVPTTRHAVIVYGTGTEPTNITICDNDFSGPYTTGVLILGGLGAKFARRNNRGTSDEYPNKKATRLQPGLVSGNKSFTGFGFKPSIIQISALSVGTVDSRFSIATIGSDGLSNGFYSTSGSSGGRSGLLSGASPAWQIVDSAGATLAEANFVSFDNDGFTVNITNTTINPWLMITVFP